jgi:hypothetical protein
MQKLLYLSGCMDCSENGMDWLKQHWQILGLFHYILHYIVYCTRITVINMQYGVNFLVDGLYNIILQYGAKLQIKKCNLRCAHTQAQQNVPGQTGPRVSNSHILLKWQ